MAFELLHGGRPDGPRRGRYRTPHGTFETPCFAPCATHGSVKGLLPAQVAAAGVELVLGNAYHLALRPGTAVVREAGGLHGFMGWDGPILTDSGGYQVFSLAGKRRVGDDGVLFAGSESGAELFLSPATALAIQRDLGADIVMALDQCPPAGASRRALADAHRRTLAWARQGRALHREWGGAERGQALFGIAQGGGEADLRAEACAELVRLDFDGYAIGGVSVGESKPDMYRAVAVCTPLLPPARIRYLMGVGEPDDLVESVLSGVDLFDCVAPTRHGRNHLAYVPGGVLRLKNACHRAAFVPLEDGCPCPACLGFTRAYLRHLTVAGEMLAAVLLTLHNLWFLEGLMRRLRERIEAGDAAAELRTWFAAAYPGWAHTGSQPEAGRNPAPNP